MNIYAVGGAIRDELLGVPVQDRDYIVVGATPEQMVAQGYRPVGKDFPVFLHPQTHEEYALARTERKTAAGYHGFQFFYAPDVTLEEDLARRDLTINAMAREVRPDGTLTGRWLIRSMDERICRRAYSGMSAMPSSKTPCGSCGWRGLPRVLRTSPWRRKRWN